MGIHVKIDPSDLRDKFAMAALTGFLMAYPDHFTDDIAGADYCYRIADAMMEARKPK